MSQGKQVQERIFSALTKGGEKKKECILLYFFSLYKVFHIFKNLPWHVCCHALCSICHVLLSKIVIVSVSNNSDNNLRVLLQ